MEFMQAHLPAALELITDAVINPRLQYWEVRDTFEHLKKTLPENVKKNPMLMLNEVVGYLGLTMSTASFLRLN